MEKGRQTTDVARLGNERNQGQSLRRNGAKRNDGERTALGVAAAKT
jgi:hypothetical protein